MKNKNIIAFMGMIILLVGSYCFVTGGKQTDVYLAEYAAAESGHQLTIKVGVASSIGFVRSCKTKTEGNRVYVTFYSAFGLNCSLGARNEFNISVDESCNEIYFNRSQGRYDLVLQKDTETGKWQRIKQL